ncbi:hypothetical protein CU102_02755 [Phyllobacterium brassicacearum]|uniref:Uncharacterized protein n=1 Tax=Phyllobacterium brassicacearum TaxID=314235 RepID=A0A2P7BU97_9HYPH|nr:hypothetical protein [Phyllobacterium brassicacearum]PSH70045.1 hypothetical protein CU102_02755 [Phyllobacterium brassicacearum]TDQ34098.1 hypothetical protein DEV91_104301 [Phyllobacterium brassicacearum]
MQQTAHLCSGFRRVRLALAREIGRPAGDPRKGYDLMMPLDGRARLDLRKWEHHQRLCTVRRFRTVGEDVFGHLRRKASGRWYIEYEQDVDYFFHWGDQQFMEGEYICVRSAGKMETYVISAVDAPENFRTFTYEVVS